MSCPNTNLPEWKLLVASRGEDVAYALWDLHDGNVPESESRSEIVKSGLKATNILQSPKADQFFNAVAKNKISGDFFWKKMQADLGIPKDQIEILKSFDTQDRGELISSLLANYSYAVEINTTKQERISRNGFELPGGDWMDEGSIDYGNYDDVISSNNKYYRITPQGEQIELTEDEIKEYKAEKERNLEPTRYYSNLTVPGGTNYTENEIATPAITPSIKGHAQFATDKGIGWFRSDDMSVKVDYFTGESEYADDQESEDDLLKRGYERTNVSNEDGLPLYKKREISNPIKTRRILEVQSDLFQKGRDKERLVNDKKFDSTYGDAKLYDFDKPIYDRIVFKIGENKYTYNPTSDYFKNGIRITKEEFKNDYLKEFGKKNENNFLQLLNQGSNWVTFFVKSIIQDSAKKGYEKVLFPSGDTASKVEGHTTLEEFKRTKELRLKQINEQLAKGEIKENFKIETRDLYSIRNVGYAFKVNNNQRDVDTSDEFKTREDAQKWIDNKNNPTYKVEINLTEDELNIYQNNLIEKETLEKELERVEGPEGFGALKPIYNFYENTVKNVLNKQYGKENVKQFTDEYGNTWNEVKIVPEREQQSILLQKTEMPASKSSKETIDVMKAAAKEMGIDFVSLADYAKSNPEIDITSVNGLADLIKGVVAIAQGMENVATTEEIVHIATAILEQTNPSLITNLISKIDRFKIYNITLNAYKGNKAYQLANGKPDIRKIKKEAVDKLIAEVIVFQSEGSTQFPELMQEENISMIKDWWNTILDFIRGVYAKSNIDIFQTAASQIATGNIGGTVADIKTKGVYFNIDATVKKQIDDYVDTVNKHADELEEILAVTDSFGEVVDKRHYLYKGIRVAKSVTEKVKERFNKTFNRTDAEKLVDDQKRDWGTEGHRFIEQYILNNLIDKLGYVRDQFGTIPISSTLSAALQIQLGTFAQNLINSYPEGTRFLIEKMVVNTKTKGMVASKVDFKAVYPVKKSDGTQGMKVDNLDWKFTTVDKTKEDADVSWFKIREWVPQMGEYTTIDQNYGITRDQVGKARMVPFIVNYEHVIPTDKKSPLIPTTLEIGKLDSLNETNLYLLPVATMAESTGNAQIDALISSLQAQYEKMFVKHGSEETEYARRAQLAQLSKAIRNLHIKINFEPLYSVAKTFLENAKTTIAEFEKIDYNNLDEAVLKRGLKELLEYQKSANKFASMDDVFLSQYPKAGMTEKNKEILDGLEDITKSTQRMQNKIIELMGIYTANLAAKQGIVSENKKMTVLEAEAQVSGWAKTWAEGTKLSAKLVNLASNLLMNASSMVNREAAKQIRLFGEILIPLETLARSQGKNAFDMIATMTTEGPKLFDKLDKGFIEKVKEAKENKNKTFLMSNVNMGELNKLAQEYIEKNLKVIEATTYATDVNDNIRIKELNRKNLRDSTDITRDTFHGFNDYNFNKFLNQTLIEEGHYSKEYQEMVKNTDALNMWKFMTALNEKGIELGYLRENASSFMPMIEATTLQKFGQTSNILSETSDFFKGLYTTRINEEQNLSKIDPETGKVKKQIPKYFIKTDKATNQLSTDLNKVGTLWIKSLLDYESAINLEDILQTLLSVEKAKGSLVRDENGSIQYDSSNRPLVQKENLNANILETVIDDGIYKLEQDLSSIGNMGISAVTGKFSKTEEGKQNSAVNFKKTLRNADTLVRALGVGLKPLIGIANWFGGQFQAYINAGGLYNYFGDFIPNNIKVTSNTMSLVEKGLIHFFTPLTEDIVTEERRRLALKQGLLKYLSTWSFSDVMMSTNAVGERLLQITNALSIIENSMVKDGKIVNIRLYLTAKDRESKYNISESERKELERTFEDRVKELKESSSLSKIATVDDNGVSIAGVNDEELAKFRTQIVEYGRKLNGQMNRDNKAGYKRDAIFNSFMMFKTWIPKLVAEHASDLNKNVEVGNWEYGRTRAFIKTWAHLGTRNILAMRDILNGTEEGLRILDEMLQEKRDEYFRKTGQELDITKEEFYDVMRKELSSQMKELKLLLILMSSLMVASAAKPPEDASDLEKNRYKWWAKALNKISDEVTFYYNPLSFEQMTKGSILPSLTLLTKVERVFIQFHKEFGDEPDKAHPGKAIFNLIPGLAQWQTEVWPFVDPEGAKAWGIRVSPQSRTQ